MFTVAYCGYYNPDAAPGERICLAAVEGDTYEAARWIAETEGWYVEGVIGIGTDFCPEHAPAPEAEG